MIRPAAVAALLAFLSVAPSAPVAQRAQLDHLVVGIRSLDEGVAQFERMTGVKAAPGGRHPGRGTENALVSLGGGTYLEIIAPQAGATLSRDDEPMRALDALAIVDWAVSVPDIDAAIASLRAAGLPTSAPQPGARVTPAGERLEWTVFGLADDRIAAPPFFIRWSTATRHPSTTAPAGCALTGLRVQDPSRDRLAAALAALDLTDVALTAGQARIEATLTCGSRRATLTSR